MNDVIYMAENLAYIKQDDNIVPFNMDDIVIVWVEDDSDMSRSTGYGPCYIIDIFILDNGQIKDLDTLKIRDEEMISNLKEFLNSRFFSIEVFNGVHFYNPSFDWEPGEEELPNPNWVKFSRKDISPIKIYIDDREYQEFIAVKQKGGKIYAGHK